MLSEFVKDFFQIIFEVHYRFVFLAKLIAQ